jgi:hypothetical protein
VGPLDISKKAACKRFLWALERLQDILALLPGFGEDRGT